MEIFKEIFKNVLAILAIAGIPSLVTAFVFNRIMKRMDREKEARDENMFMLIGLSMAGVDLSIITAISYKSDRKNGELTEAIEKARKMKCEYENFITKQCVGSIQ